MRMKDRVRKLAPEFPFIRQAMIRAILTADSQNDELKHAYHEISVLRRDKHQLTTQVRDLRDMVKRLSRSKYCP